MIYFVNMSNVKKHVVVQLVFVFFTGFCFLSLNSKPGLYSKPEARQNPGLSESFVLLNRRNGIKYSINKK